MTFVGAQSIYTCAKLAHKNDMYDFLWGGGGHVPTGPPSVSTPWLFVFFSLQCFAAKGISKHLHALITRTL